MPPDDSPAPTPTAGEHFKGYTYVAPNPWLSPKCYVAPNPRPLPK
ncbi:hypothetical protein SLEP1_g2996 [Rubroshorea leprosula]|nr:hypothetical protein SLEP1_g2996 [Rubroshorea leprosula]